MTEGHLQDLELSAYLDGETDAAARPRVEAHLAACQSCREALSALRALQVGLRGVPVPEPEASYWTEFAQRVEIRLEATSDVPVAEAPRSTRGYERLIGWLLPGGHFGWSRAAGALAALTLFTVVGLRGVGNLAYRGRPAELQSGAAREAPGSIASRKEVDSPRAGSTPPSSPQPTSSSEGRLVVDQEQGAALEKGAAGAGAAGDRAAEGQRPNVEPQAGDDRVLAGRAEESKVVAPPSGGAKPSPPAEPSAGVEGGATGSVPKSVASAGRFQSPEVQGPPDSVARQDRIVALLEGAQSSPPPTPADKLKSLIGKTSPSLEDKDEKGSAHLQYRDWGPANELEGAVQRFVGAALEADTARARELYAGLGSSAALGTGEAMNAMRRWLDALPHAPATGAELDHALVRMRNSAAAMGVEPWLALDALVWPRRDTPQLKGAGERLARELAAGAPSDVRARDRARVWLQWLAERAPDPATRSRWDELLRRLP